MRPWLAGLYLCVALCSAGACGENSPAGDTPAAAAPASTASATEPTPTAPEQPQVTFTAVHVPSPEGTYGIAGVFDISGGWHIYWHNPGDAGLATKLTVDRGAKVEFPLPERFVSPGEIESFGYGHKVALFTFTHPPEGDATIEVKASWLACKDSCIKQKATVELNADSPLDESLADQRARVPQRMSPRAYEATWEGDTLRIRSPVPDTEIVDFFPASVDPMIFDGVQLSEGGAKLSWHRGGTAAPKAAQGVVVLRSSDPNAPQAAYTVHIPWPPA